jgi:hypothetical protein
VGAIAAPDLKWLSARYCFHTFTYRDPRAPYSSAPALPVVSPTAVLLGIASTLFTLGLAAEGSELLRAIHICKVKVDPPEGVVFFRAFHQARRYETDKYDRANPRLGFTAINQAMREHGLTQGPMTIFVGVPLAQAETARLALENRDHLGTHDSLCSLDGPVEFCDEPEDVVYLPPEEPFPIEGVTIVSLSRFRCEPRQNLPYWWLAGGEDTEIVPYVIPGRFRGTSRGKIYRKRGAE